MWEKISVFILRNRLLLIVSLLLLTAFMVYQARFAKLTYDNPKFIPDNDKEYKAYQTFKKTFGDDGSVMVIGVETEKINTPEFFNDWCSLSDDIENTEGIQRVLSIANIPRLTLGYETNYIDEDSFIREVFVQEQVIKEPVKSQEELDSLIGVIKELRFYEGIIFRDSCNFSLMAITLKKNILDSKKRIGFVNGLVDKVDAVVSKHDVDAHYSGLPYIRTKFSKRVETELRQFTVLSMLITALILLFFFRSLYILIFSMLVVTAGVFWSMGILVLLGFKITMFIGLLPPLIVVIGIANCIYLINKYHDEFRTHKNKIKALQRVVSRVGIAVFFTNLTTAIGFGVFVLTGSTVLQEFGLTAFLSVMSVFVISIIVIPIIFSFLPEPPERHTKHLDSKYLNKLIDKLSHIVTNKRKQVYIVTSIVVVAMIIGMSLVNAVGFMVDDISKSDPIYQDLKFFEKNVKGVLPFEVVVDTKKTGGIQDPSILRRMNTFESDVLGRYDVLSRSISIAQVINFARQELHDGDRRFYRTPGNMELSRIMNLMPSAGTNDRTSMVQTMVDSSNSKARISVQMADIGTKETKVLREEILAAADSVFNYRRNGDELEPVDSSARVDIRLTGTSMIFVKGNDYLNRNLLISLIVAFLVIGLIMATIFISVRMIVISMIPNIIPLLISAGCMGYFGVALKPSTVLVFSVAFGIAVDFTIHFLSKYRMELQRNRFNIQKAVSKALTETGVSMVYTSIILFFGFIIFAGSSFGGTIALGVFTSLTLIVALLSNLIVLPSLLLSYDQAKERAKSKRSPLIDYPDDAS